MEVKYDLVIDFARPSKSNTIIISEGDKNSRLLHFTLLNNKQPMSMSDVAHAKILGISSSGAHIWDDTITILKDESGNPINELEYLLAGQFSDNTGTNTMTITLTSEDKAVLTSFEFYVFVRNALYNEDDLATEDDYVNFRDMLSAAETAIKKIEDLSAKSALPNLTEIIFHIEGKTYTYIGDEKTPVEITLDNMAYIADNPVIDVDPIDESAASEAARYAAEAKNYSDQAHTSAEEIERVGQNVSENAAQVAKDKDDVYFKTEEAKSYTQTSIDGGLVSEGFAKGTQNGVPVGEGSPYFENNAEYFSSRLSVEDRLDSADKNKSLSANQGRVLNDIKADRSELSQIQTSVDGMGTMVNALSLTVGEIESNYYPKPASGIPYADLEKGVRDILDETAEIPVIKEDINGVIEDLTQIYDDGFASRNLAYKQLKGYYLSGSGVVSANATYNLFIAKVEPSKTYIITSDETSYYYSLFANEPQPSSVAIDNVRHSGSRTVTIPSGANYIGFLAKNGFGMIEQGTEAHDYQPFAKSNTELTQIVDDAIERGFYSNNLWQINPITISANAGVTYEIPLKQGKYIFKIEKAVGGGNFNFYGVVSSNEVILSNASWTTAINGIPFETTKDYQFLRIYTNTTVNVNIQIIKQGDADTSYHDYVPSNIELKENLNPTEYIASGLTYSNATYVSGGYFKIGNLAIINLRLTTSSTSNITINGLPKYTNKTSSTIVKVNIFDTSDASLCMNGTINSNGTLTIVNSNNGRTLIVSAMYLCD